jgi:hypothetical protein
MFSDPVPSLPPIREGKLVALGVSSLTRWPASPEIPPIAEAGVPGFDAVAWSMIVAPAHTPNAIVNKLHSKTSNCDAQSKRGNSKNMNGMWHRSQRELGVAVVVEIHGALRWPGDPTVWRFRGYHCGRI